jgi:uncharacterized phage protein (TIGR01671 family)
MAEMKQRPIKFRAWHKKHGMTYKDEVWTIESLYNQNLDVFASPSKVYSFKDFVVMQYTGLDDKNGTPIFEGDLITDAGGWTYHVRWNNGAFVRDRSVDLQGTREIDGWDTLRQENTSLMEVIGNIFQNGNLINAKD